MMTSTTPLSASLSFTSTSIEDFSARNGAASSRSRCHVSDFLHVSRCSESAKRNSIVHDKPSPEGVISEFRNPSKPAACVRALACHAAKSFSASRRSWNFTRRIAALADEEELLIAGGRTALEQTNHP